MNRNYLTLLLILFLNVYAHNASAQNHNALSLLSPANESKPWDNAQVFKPNEPKDLKNILGLQLGITEPVLGLSYERLFSSKVGVEFAIGLIGLSIGPKIYFSSLTPGKVSFYTGIIVGEGYFAEGVFGYLPIGISRLTKSNFIFSLDIGPNTSNVYSNGDSNFAPGARLKVAKAF
jgi:hypothetical protein